MNIHEKSLANTKRSSVVFINPPGPSRLYRSIVCTFISKANYIWQPQDFVTLSAHVPQDYELQFFDCSLDKIPEERLFGKIKSLAPKICIAAVSSIVYEQDLVFLKHFYSHFPEIKLLVLGDILLEKIFWKKVFEYADGLILNSINIDLASYIKHGVSNSPNLVLKDTWLDNTKEGNTNQKPKKVSIGIPRHKLFIDTKYRFPFVKSYIYTTVSTQFGCPYHCEYCSQCRIPVAYRDFNEVLEEIEKICQLGGKDVFFGDPSFGFPKDNAVQLLEGIIAKNFPIRWACYTNPGLVDNKFLKLMKKAGCHTVIIGIEDEDTDMLQEKYRRNLSRPRLVEFCRECEQLDIQICGDFIIGLNSDNLAVNRMVQFAKDLKLDYASFNILTPLLGSKIREKLIEKGTLDPYTIGFDTSGTFGQGTEKLIRLRNMAIKKFYLRPGYLLHRMMNITSFTEFMIQLQEMAAMFQHHVLKRKTS